MKKSQIQLSEHFTYKKLLRFTLPSIIMMVFTSLYGVVDGVFVTNYVGHTHFAAINLIMPYIMIFGTFGFMIGTGGSALVSKTLGEQNNKKANEIFSLLIYSSIIGGLVLTAIGISLLKPISRALGAEGDMLEYCVTYGTIILSVLTFYILQNAFQSFLVTAEKPKLGLSVTIIAGIANILLDALFILVFGWGLVGAAAATAISQMTGGIIPLIYFCTKNSSLLRLGKTKFYGKALVKTCTNGSSEFVSNVSMSVVNMLYNYQLLQLVGEAGISAYGVIMYVNFIFVAVYFGYSLGAAPIIGYHYGTGSSDELKNLSKKSLVIITVSAVTLTVMAECLAYPLAYIFTGKDQALMNMTIKGLMIYSLSFLISGYNIYGSAFFTALNNGFASALISLLRMLLFQTISVLVLPVWLGLNGVWIAIIVAELCALAVTVTCYIVYKKRYHY